MYQARLYLSKRNRIKRLPHLWIKSVLCCLSTSANIKEKLTASSNRRIPIIKMNTKRQQHTIQRIFGVNLNYFNIETILNSKYIHTTIKSCKPYNFFSCAIWHKQFEIPVRIIPPLILSLLYIELLLPYIVKYDVAFVCTKPSLMYFR